MFAIFNNENDAIEFEAKIHAYLCKNRSGYTAQTKQWSDITKHYADDFWAVSMPPADVPVEDIGGEYSTASSLDGWRPEPEEPI